MYINFEIYNKSFTREKTFPPHYKVKNVEKDLKRFEKIFENVILTLQDVVYRSKVL